MDFGNPYKAISSVELDAWLHNYFFKDSSAEPMAYSSDERAAEKLRSRLKTMYGYRVQTGTTSVRNARYFARLESGPSTSTETLAETLPLAVSRLALVVASRRDPDLQ